ncbi:hypothetical protein KFK09_013355 [Dendrobium nobile]|uniref:Uncharacterized protein n=1 Tax=Dendrobium nobile TaxID=94219 RepID=A0A8T3B737_DENNO|nr:hypothetical protein KFK09_013355 [Dendrobium nobile]
MYQDAKEEIEQLKVQLQEMQNVHKITESSLNADLESLKAELSQKSQLQTIISKLEQQLSVVDTKHKEEISFILDESNRNNKMYQDAKDEVEAVKVKISRNATNVYKTTESSLQRLGSEDRCWQETRV